MFPKHNKITTGFVIQTFYTLPNGNLICIDQQFHAGDVDYENMDGDTVTVDTVVVV